MSQHTPGPCNRKDTPGTREKGPDRSSRPGHTPGPWKVEDGIFVVGSDKLSIFGGASTKRSDEVCEANARLIAAAPEMYDLISRYMHTWDGAHSDPADEPKPGCLVCEARTLLAKVDMELGGRHGE